MVFELQPKHLITGRPITGPALASILA